MTIAILVGGESRRFGQDKAALFLPRVLAACEPLGLPIVVVGRTTAPILGSSASSLPDDFPGQGPLGGLVTVLRRTANPVLLLACDLAFLETSALRWLLEQWDQQADKALPLVAIRRLNDTEGESVSEPLFSIYPSSSLELAEELLTMGRRSMHGLLKQQGCYEALLPESLLPQIRNVNTPEDIRSPER